MAESYIGEVRMAGFNFAPQGWAFCDGSLLSIAEFSVLFNLIGTTYGGNGTTTFALPDLRGRIAFHQGNGYVIGESAGSETVTLTTSQIPAHSHPFNAQSGAGTQPSPSGGVWAKSSLDQFSTGSPSGEMAATSLQSSGGSQPHDNLPPFLVVNYIISLFGVYPSQN
jgi:microcystin-dependent protein